FLDGQLAGRPAPGAGEIGRPGRVERAADPGVAAPAVPLLERRGELVDLDRGILLPAFPLHPRSSGRPARTAGCSGGGGPLLLGGVARPLVGLVRAQAVARHLLLAAHLSPAGVRAGRVCLPAGPARVARRPGDRACLLAVLALVAYLGLAG